MTSNTMNIPETNQKVFNVYNNKNQLIVISYADSKEELMEAMIKHLLGYKITDATDAYNKSEVESETTEATPSEIPKHHTVDDFFNTFFPDIKNPQGTIKKC